ncbi:hypothetical protein GZH46_03034, partial [Fragariocoptes setiger]
MVLFVDAAIITLFTLVIFHLSAMLDILDLAKVPLIMMLLACAYLVLMVNVGCLGVYTNRQNILKLFALMSLFNVIFATIGFSMLWHMHEISHSIEKKLNHSIDEYNWRESDPIDNTSPYGGQGAKTNVTPINIFIDKQASATYAWDFIQTIGHCCGINEPDDWFRTPESLDRFYPRSCCHTSRREYSSQKSYCTPQSYDFHASGCKDSLQRMVHGISALFVFVYVFNIVMAIVSIVNSFTLIDSESLNRVTIIGDATMVNAGVPPPYSQVVKSNIGARPSHFKRPNLWGRAVIPPCTASVGRHEFALMSLFNVIFAAIGFSMLWHTHEISHAIEKKLNHSIDDYNWRESEPLEIRRTDFEKTSSSAATSVWDTIQTIGDCCGITKPDDWFRTAESGGQFYPHSCCLIAKREYHSHKSYCTPQSIGLHSDGCKGLVQNMVRSVSAFFLFVYIVNIVMAIVALINSCTMVDSKHSKQVIRVGSRYAIGVAV